MLTLQRASAGSGKTYTLTKKYIELLIFIRDEKSGKRRLRTKNELADSAQHILAVTFTNKATNEMKERIVGKLYELAYPPADGKVDYMEDYCREYGVEPAAVSEACKEALHQLLYEYSDFNISTIDAFFQNVLRTFAYESELPDSYQVVIEGDHIARTAAVGLFDDISRGTTDEDERFWIRRMIDEAADSGGTYWNPFQQRDNGRTGSYGVFGKISSLASSLDKEEYAEILKCMEDFRNSGINLRESLKRIEDGIARRSAILFAPMAEAAKNVLTAYDNAGAMDYFPGGNRQITSIKTMIQTDADPLGHYSITAPKSHLGNRPTAAVKRSFAHLASDWEAFIDLWREWKAYKDSDDVKYWKILRKSLPEVALILSIHRRINDWLQDNDAMKLADTNAMIHRIIAEGDVPFIYERLGTRLNHFLIDEFQDTSGMQWENFRPLLLESESHDFDNLIIGDAKQSIYRFRGAEPGLITDIVPATFSRIRSCGLDRNENSNWRSRRNIVLFNNIFFRALSSRISKAIAELYTNTVQFPRSKEDEKGYVEINYYTSENDQSDSEEKEEDPDSKKRKIPLHVIERIGTLITDLLRRGYHQKEIAILVNTRQAAKEVIDGLMDYNLTLPVGTQQLDFVSEDSLTLDSSESVNTLIECFRLIQDSIEGKEKDKSALQDGRGINWTDIRNNFRYYSAGHSGESLQQRLEGFFHDELGHDIITEMLNGMQAITLPSLTEALIEIFVDPVRRRSEAPFLAAFQDALLDYCEINPTDIGSLLRWWDVRGNRITISSPDDTDAINVMTIHKSKGLEFECVILPEMDFNIDLKSTELWVKVPENLSYAPLIPAILPVRLSKKQVAETIWNDLFEAERHLEQVDMINKAYVAMTRAVSELYVFLPSPFKKDTTEIAKPDSPYMRFHSYAIMSDIDTLIAGSDPDEKDMLPEEDKILPTEEGTGFRYGTPLADVGAALEKSRQKKSKRNEIRRIKEYFVNSDREVLKFHPEGFPPVLDIADDDREDPRSEGSLKHAVLEHVIEEEDLPMALSRLRGRGLITRRMMREYEPELQEALESVRDRGWFDGSCKVLNERPLLLRGEQMKRPDRVMLTPDGDAIVVDYKFGDVSRINEHRRQVGEYMGRLEAMKRFRRVRGYIWYVTRREIIEVTSPIPFRNLP